MDKYIVKVSQMNNKLLNDLNNYISVCEHNYKSQMEKIVEYFKINSEIKFILLAGPSSSGKTTTARLLKECLEQNGFNAKSISLDDFFVERVDTPLWDNGKPNYESVDSIDWKLFSTCTHNLQTQGKSVMPTYDFITGTKSYNTELSLKQNDVIIIEGLHSLNPIIDNFIQAKNSLKIYLAPSIMYLRDDEEIMNEITLRFFRRLIRDVYTRGSTPDKTLYEWDDVRRGEKLYIDPYKSTANFSINSSHPYEVAIYKSIIKELNLEQNERMKPLLKPFDNFVAIDKKSVPKDSLIQEFVH